MYYNFLTNVMVIVFLCGVAILLDSGIIKKFTHYFMGIVFGLITIFVMAGKSVVVQDRFFDFSHISMTMAGFIGGPITAVIATTLSCLYRYNMGGSGVSIGISSIFVFACIGSILGRRSRSSQTRKKGSFWFVIGIFMALMYLLVNILSTTWTIEQIKALTVVAVFFLIFTPLVTTILFQFYYWNCDIFSRVSILDTIIKYIPINLLVFDAYGPILLSENLKKQRTSSPHLENTTLLLYTDKSLLNERKQRVKEIATQDGRYFNVELSGFQMPQNDFACVAIMNEVTDLKREQEMLKDSKVSFSKSFLSSPLIMTILRDSDCRVVEVTSRLLEISGFSRDELLGKTPIELGMPKQELLKLKEIYDEQGSIKDYECSLIMKNSSSGSVMLSAEKIEYDNQECLLIVYNDVTEMKRMYTERDEERSNFLMLEADLSKNYQLMEDIRNNMPDGFYVLDEQWRFTYINKKAEELFTRSRESLLGGVIWELIQQAQGTIFEINLKRSMDDYVPITFDYQSFADETTWFQVIAYPSQIGLSVYFRDITERKISREKLIESQKEVTSILESMTDCFLALDRDWKITYVNRAGEKALEKSRDELLCEKMTDLFNVNEIMFQKFNEVIINGKSVNFEVVSETLHNKCFEISGYPTENGVTVYFRDVTSRKRSENELARLDRLNLVGQLAAGIGHEIRNPMTTVRGYLQLLGEKPAYASQKATFDLMISELDRANVIITEFLSLARLKKTELRTQNLNDILTNLYPLLEADTFTQNKQICYIPGEIPNLELNGKEISQLVLNLTRNGLEAMQEGGCLTIKSYLQDCMAVLEIADEGCGIPAENMTKVGTPFFTTKETGTGLGLASCYKIAESHSAKIHIDSTSSGTTFFLLFPIHEAEKVI